MSHPQLTLTPPIKPATSRQRILSVHLPFLSTDRIARERWGKPWRTNNTHPEGSPNPCEHALVITDKVKNAIRLVALNEKARDMGLYVEQSLSDARALYPDLDCVERDQAADTALLGAIRNWCERYTPLVAQDRMGGLFLDITGCAHLMGGEHGLATDLSASLTAQGFGARIAIADTPGAAWGLSHFSENPVTIAPHGSLDDVLANLPLGALRLPRETVSGLKRMGLKTLGCLYHLPRAPLAARFGGEILLKLDQALGHQEEAISPETHVPDLVSERRFHDPIALEDDIKRCIHSLAGNLKAALEKRGLGLRRMRLRLFRVDGECFLLEVHAANPVRDPDHILRLFSERLAGLHSALDAGFGFDMLRLEAAQSEAYNETQGDLVSGRNPKDGLASLIDRLGARLGPERINVFQAKDTHVPERNFGFLPAIHAANDAPQWINPARADNPLDEEITACSATHPVASSGSALPGEPVTRPLLLLRNPEAIEVVAQVPEGPPARFRWRKVLYEIARAEGPERIAAEWWQEGRHAFSRDYFRVEDARGHRFWLFRHGLYGRETNTPVWYLHGVFG